MDLEPRPDNTPSDSSGVSDDARQATANRLQQAVGDGVLTLEEFIARLDAVYAAATTAELQNAAADLPATPTVGTSRTVKWLLNIFGDEKRAGAWRAADTITGISVFGDICLDLRGAYVDGNEVTIRTWLLFGDTELIVPEGIEVDLNGFSLFGDRKLDLAAVPRVPGTPRIRLLSFSLFGDAQVRNTQRSDSLRDRFNRFLGRAPEPPTDSGGQLR